MRDNLLKRFLAWSNQDITLTDFIGVVFITTSTVTEG
jgi:hypothetical protein